MDLYAKIKTGLKSIDRFSLLLFYHGLQFACGLAAMSLLFSWMADRSADYLYLTACAKSAFDGAVATAAGCFADAVICDIVMRDRKSGDT